MTVEIQSLAIAEVKLIRSPKFGDHRGFFSETWNKRALREGGLDLDFVQDNHSFSSATGTVRGLHFQTRRARRQSLCVWYAASSLMLPSIYATTHRPMAST